MRKKLIAIVMLITLLLGLSGCTQADKVSANISKEADNFNTVRQITVINCIQGEVLFQMTGKMSLFKDDVDNQLEVTVEDNGTYKKHFIGLSDNVTYVVEDITNNNVSNYRYTINFNPEMWFPVDVKTIE